MRWLLLVSLAACADPAAIASNTCGNWVLETGEDCDRPGGACTEDCRISCDPTAHTVCDPQFDGLCCPSGAACGLDRSCHYATGTFSLAEATAPLVASQLAVSDLDGDGTADVIGVGALEVRTLYGSPRSPFATQAVVAAPAALGPAAVGDDNGDGHLDLVWPVSRGLAAMTTASGSPQPVAFANYRDRPASSPPVIRMTASGFVDLFVESGPLNIDLVSPFAFGGTKLPCDRALVASQLTGHTLHAWDDAGNPLVPIQFETTLLGPAPMCVEPLFDTGGGRDGAGLVAPGAPGTVPSPIGETFFANVRGGACPDLYAAALQSTGAAPDLVRYDAAGSAGQCTIAPLAVNLGFTGAPLAPIQLHGATGLVTTQGVAEATGHCFGPIDLCVTAFLSTGLSWRYAVVGDLDADGLEDFAVMSDQAAVDIYFQTATGWTLRSIPLPAPVTDLAVGDFDHDGVKDLAVLVGDQLRFGFATGHELALGAPQPVPGALTLATLQRDDVGVPPQGVFGDALVVSTRLAGVAGLVTFASGADRRPLAALPLIDQHGSNGRGDVVLTGRFAPDGAAGLLALFRPALNGDPAAFPFALGMFAPLGGSLTEVDQLDTGTACSGDSGFCATEASWIVVPRPSGDLAIGFAGPSDLHDCGVFFRGGDPINLLKLSCGAFENGAAKVTSARTLIGGDTALLLINGDTLYTLTFGNAPLLSAPVSILDVVSTAGLVATACVDGVALEMGSLDAGAITYGGEGRDVAVACFLEDRTEIFGLFAPPAAIATDPVTGRHLPPQIRLLFTLPGAQPIQLSAGDIDGDGLEDLLYLRDGVLHARPQCDPHQGCT